MGKFVEYLIAAFSEDAKTIRSLVFKRGSVYSVLAFCATAAILLPAHPSLQELFLTYGVPAPMVSAIFAAPLFFAASINLQLSRNSLLVLLLFFLYIWWLLVRAAFSPAIGQPNYLASLRSIFILTPLALFCALFAAKDLAVALKSIMIFSLFSLAHYCILTMGAGGFGESSGFRSLSSGDRSNYQATSFYFGLAGIGAAALVVCGRGYMVLIGVAGFLGSLILMGTVGARASIVAMIISSVVVGLFFNIRKIVKYSLLALPIGLLLAAIIWVSGIFESLDINSQLMVVDRFLVLTQSDDPSQRLRLFSAAIDMWLESSSTFFIGGGIGAFPQFIGEDEGEGWYPHNFILESLAEGGVVAFAPLALIAFVSTARFIAFKSENADVGHAYLCALAIYAFVAYQFMGGLQTVWIPIFFIALFLFKEPGKIS
jgi:O-antigen ligase